LAFFMIYCRPEASAGGRRMFKILIAEDDLLIADMVEECLIVSEYEVCGIARTVIEAVALGRLAAITPPVRSVFANAD
jgi:hypothetical protein